MKNKLVLGTRGSLLALRQSNIIAQQLKQHFPDLALELQIIKTQGDIITDTALGKIGDKGLFVKEIEQALLNGSIDFAVHSMKDLPTESSPELMIAAVPEREDPRDVLVARDGLQLEELPRGAVIGTGSLRRGAQLRCSRPDLAIADIRGNVETRLRKLDESLYDAIVLALAGLRRIGHEDRATQILAPELLLPAPAQGALALQIRSGDERVLPFVKRLHHAPSALAAAAERAFLLELEGGCHAPIAALCRFVDGAYQLQGCVLSADGKRRIAGALAVDPQAPEQAGTALARRLLTDGAADILAQLKGACNEQ